MIESKLVYELLKRKGVNFFYHANTVKTALTFIQEKALLSRQYIETKNLIQTDQYTDDKDKKLGIWDAVFLDGTDLHKKLARPNYYGPILFQMNLNILLNPLFKTVRVTKSNPEAWKSADDNFYENIEDLDAEYLVGNKISDVRIMFLFDSVSKSIELDLFCEKIVIDDPRVNLVYPNGDIKAISNLVKLTIENELKSSNLLKIPVEIRHMDNKACGCYFQYKNMYSSNIDKFNKLFQK
jgi:hypothetical protein